MKSPVFVPGQIISAELAEPLSDCSGVKLEGAAAGGQRGLALSQCDVHAEH